MEYNGFNIKSDGTFGYLKVHTIGAGKLPKILGGLYTSIGNARKAVDSYINHKEAAKNGKANS